MRKSLGCLLILLLSTVYLSGCVYLRPVGPCYGIGCPTLTSSQPGQSSQPGKAQASKAPDQKATPKKSLLARLLPKWAQPNQGN